MMDSPNKTLEYVNFHFKKVKAKYGDIDDQILKSALAYQYLSICYLQEMLSIDSILIENKWEIGLIGPGNSCLTQILECLFGRFRICHLHSCLHDAYGRFYEKYHIGRGYKYATTKFSCFKSYPLFGHITGLCWCLLSQLTN